MKTTKRIIVAVGMPVLAMTGALLLLAGDQPKDSARLLVSPKGPNLAVRLQLACSTNEVTYVVQSSTNLFDWKTILAVKPKPGSTLEVGNFPATNASTLFRLLDLGPVGETNPPAWSNGVGGQLTGTAPGRFNFSWAAASDDTGVSEYRLFVNGVQVTNVLGSVLSYDLNLDPHVRTDVRIQAVDPFGNATDVLTLAYLPGDNLLAVSDDSGRVYTAYIQSNGSFSALTQLASIGGAIRGLGLGDFDRDGLMDLVVGSPSGNTLDPFFYRGKGDGTFAPAVPLASTSGASSYEMDATVGDFDADGYLDVVLDGNSRYVFFYWGNGDGTFTLEVKDWGASNFNDPRGMAAGDFNEDGREDIARASCCSGYLKVFLSKGDRTFIETNLVATGVGNNDPYGVAAGDFDEDGHVDLLVMGGVNGDVSFFQGLGNGSFTNITGTNGLWANLDINNHSAIDAFDYDGDGHLDLVMSSYSSHNVYFWSGLGDGTFSTNRITVATGLGNTLGISAPPKPPRVDVWIAPIDFVTNLNGTVQFAAQGAGVGEGDTFLWSFGDTGTNRYAWTFTDDMTNMGPSISHNYTNEGRFLTRLLHTDSHGIKSARGTWVTVESDPPVANPGGPYSFGELSATQAIWYATLDGSASSDDFGIVSYLWYFGDGSSMTNSGPLAAHSWNGPGTWNVTLVVVDAAGQRDTNSTTVTFTPGDAPIAAISGPTIVDETAAVNGVWSVAFSATNSSDDVGIWKYDWNFGNGRTASGRDVSTTYTATGTYTVRLTVTDNANQTNSVTQDVLVKANAGPVASISGSLFLTEFVATNGLWFGSFSGTNSTDDRGIYQYNWNFGDGGTASGANVTHNYAGVGIYPLVLTVTDFGNQTTSVTQNVVVVANDFPVARITASTLTPEGTQPVDLSGITSTDDRGIMSYQWELPQTVTTFDGEILDTNVWIAANTVQSNKLITTGQNNWDNSYFYSTGSLVPRGTALEARVDTPSGTAHAMFGFRNQDNSSGNYNRLVYAIYFNNGSLQIYEYGNYRGQPTSYSPGTSYDIRIETKLAGGASYYIRPSGSGTAFTKIFETSNYSDASFGVGGVVYANVFGFDDLKLNLSFGYRDISASLFPGGPIKLTVTDHALQSASTTIVINCVTGTPPIAVMNGPTNGLAGFELAYEGYASSDDHGIASYTWDFGDGTPTALGPAVSHRYQLAGVYTNRLTVADYAGQTSVAELVVTIEGESLVRAVPWRIIGGIIQPHEVYSGKTNTLKAVARGIPVPFDYVWNYGDGSGTVTNTVTNSALLYNLQATHAYTGSEGTPFYPTVQVYLTNGMVLGDTYSVLIRPKTLDVEMKVAIDEGLWSLHKIQTRYDIDTNNVGGYWTANGYSISASASAVHAFGINGHTVTDDGTMDPYVDTVQRGVNYLLTALKYENIGAQDGGDPDGNHNGIALYGNTGQPIYETGPMMDAFVAAARPELVARVGGANVKGRTFQEIMQDLVDAYCWGQYDDVNVGGGWRYGWNSFPDNSAAQWGAIGMLAARDFWGIAIPQWVIERNKTWINYSRGGTGYGYTGGGGVGYGPGGVEATTPSALVQAAFDGITTTNGVWTFGENYLANNWQAILNLNNVYANYAIAKAMRTALPEPVHNFAATGKDWFNDPVNGLARVTIDRQRADGSWHSDRWVDDPLASAWSVIILSSSLFQRGPVAVINVAPNPAAVGYPVTFDARSSYHQHPAYKVVDFRWDFDSSDGVDFEHPDAVGPVVTNSYGALGTNVISLQVRDNATPALRDVATVSLRVSVPPFPPTADAGGPYVVSAGQDLHLDGSGSFVVDAASDNFIQSWDWETDFEIPLDFDDSVTGPRPTITGGFALPGQYSIGLRVKNANSLVYSNFNLPDLTADAFTTVYVYDRVINDLAARPKANKIQLTWTKVGDYAIIHRSTLGPDRGFSEIGRTDSSYATFLDTNVEYNVEYYYRIFAYNNGQANPLGVSDPKFNVSRQRGLEDHPPRFQSTPLRIALVGQLYNERLDAKDPENDPIVFNLLSGPTNMTVNPTSGAIAFTPTSDQIGNHSLSFEATNAAGRDVLSFNLFVFPASNNPPVAVAGGPYAGLTGDSIQFSSVGTSDPNGDALKFYWNFGDGQSSTNPNPAHVYNAAGEYLVTLFVNDGFGGTASANTRATIERPNRAPIASVAKGPHFAARLGERITLDGSASYDLDGDPLTFTWIWGDGVTNANAGTTASHLFTTQGNYSGRLLVADNRGGQGSYDFDVAVAGSNQPPVVVLNVSTNRTFVKTTVVFDATGTVDPDGDPITFNWDFDDRTKTTGQIVTHVFNAINAYSVRLAVTDNHGGQTVVTQAIQVVNSPPVFTTTPPLLVKANNPYTYLPEINDLDGDVVTFQLVTGPATMSSFPATGQLDWLPGTNDLGPNPVVLRALDTHGGSNEQAFSIVVTTPTGPEVDLEPIGIVMTNVTVNSATLALSGSITALFRNNGSDPVPVPFTVSAFVDVDGDGAYSTNLDRVVGSGVFPAGFSNGYIGIIEMGLHGSAQFQGAPLSIVVDSQHVVPEYDENNNTRRFGFEVDTNRPPSQVMDVSASFLQVDRSPLPAAAGLTARLGNSGFVIAPTNVAVAFYDGNPAGGGTLIGVARSSQALSPGQFQDLSVNWNSPAIAKHTVYVRADDDGTGTGSLTEITKTNNLFSAEADLTANEPPIADAGDDQTVNIGDYVLLNGGSSKDPEGRTLGFAWTMVSVPIGSRATLTNATTVQPHFLPDLVGKYTVNLVVNDGTQNSTNLSTVLITVVDPNANHPPTITSTPSFQGMSNVVYTYAVQATDADNDPLQFRLAQAPVGMTINTNTGLIQWTPTTTGSFFVQVIVTDPQGAGYYQSYSLNIIAYQNLPPQFTSTPVQTASPGTPYSYSAVANDPNLDNLTYALPTKPTGMSINASSGVISWTPTAGQLGGNAVVVTASDGKGGVASQSFNVVVLTSGSNGPVVLTIPDQSIIEPAKFVNISLDNYVFDPTYPKSQMIWSVSGTNLLSVTISSNRVATVAYAAGTVTSERLTFLATNPDGKSAYAAPLFSVRGVDNPPVAGIANLSDTDTTSLTSGFFELSGTADDPDAIDAVAYRVLLYDPVSGVQAADVTPKPVNAAGWHEGRVSAGGSLGRLDLTTVQNGGYTLLLVVRGGNKVANALAPIALDSNLKLGQYTFSQQDAVVPVAGAAIRIIRTYDSFNLRAGDFGYSWTHTVADLDLKLNEERIVTQDLFGENFSMRVGGGRDVTLNMPDTGRRVTFRYSLGAAGMFKLRANWTPPPGINASLVPTVSPNMISLFGLNYWEAAPPETGIDGFDFPGFILTLQDGTQYRIDREYLGDHFVASDSAIGSYVSAYGKAFLRRINDPSGDRTELVHAGATLKSIQKYSATGQKLKTVLFQRDAQNRIAAVYTPENLDTNDIPVGPATVTYEYDSAGNLSKVNKLTDASDPTNLVYATTTYIYGHAQFPHYLTEIRDPRGVAVTRAEYDSSGRIVATVDAKGNRTEISHDVVAQTETVYDRLGNATLYAYDNRGNVVAEVDALGGVTRRAFDANNYKSMEVDPSGQTNYWVHDASGNVLSHTDPLGNVTTSTYDGAGRLLTSTDPLGHTTMNAYDSRGNLTNVTDAAGNVTSYTYDSANRKTSMTDPLGKTTTYQYDSGGNLIKVTDPVGSVTTYTYDANGYQTGASTITEIAPGVFRTNASYTTYNADGAPLSVTDGAGNTRRNEYDALGDLTARIDALGHRTEYQYDERSQLMKTLYPDGTSTSYGYDEMGRRTSVTDRAGRTTYYEYDPLGRLITTVYRAEPGAEIPIVRSEYDAAGRLAAMIDERGNRTSYAYDGAGRQIATTNALGFVSTSAYDAADRKISDTDPLGNTTYYLYDNLDRLIRTIFPDGTSTRTTYDNSGRVIAEIDQAGLATTYEYDSVGLLTAVIDPLGQRTEYAYNESGDMIRQRDANGHETRYEPDPLAQTTTTILPGGQRSTTYYNALGLAAATTNFNGGVIQYEYDVNNRLAARRLPGGKSVQFTYTPVGRRQSITDSRGVTSFTYDARDRLARRTDPDGRTISYEYDLSGNRTRIVTCSPGSLCRTQSFSFDALNRMIAATAPDGGVTSYTYDGANNLISATLPNGTVRSNAYDSLNRLTAVENLNGGTVLSSHRYALGVTGQRVAVHELNGRELRYAYDAAQRLTGERVFGDPAGVNRTNNYAYDSVGNRLSFGSLVNPAALTEENVGYAYDSDDRLLAETNSVSGDVTYYVYDDNGNPLSRSNSVSGTTYLWSADNRLMGATINDAGGVHQLTYDYDAEGLRVGATIVENGSTNRINFLVDANRARAQVLEQWSSLDGQPYAMQAAYHYGVNLISQNRDGLTSYFHPDGLGSTRVLSDPGGMATDSYDYDAFGRVIARSGTTANDYLFTGEQRDAHLGLDYLRERYLVPGQGRFFGRDPLVGDPRSPIRRHPYLYAGNDPVNRVDPSGRQFDLISISVSLQINTTIDAYQVAFAKAGLAGIKRTTKIVDHVLNPAIKIQEMALDLMEAGAPGAEEMFRLGQELEQMAYRLLQSVIAGIYVETFNSAKISFTLGPIKGELGLVSGSISAFGKKAEYGADLADYDATMQKILDGIDKQIQGIENPPTLDTKLEEGADQIFKYCEKVLDKLGSGPGKWDWSNKKDKK